MLSECFLSGGFQKAFRVHEGRIMEALRKLSGWTLKSFVLLPERFYRKLLVWHM
jgi:hypothetical protein